jgi:DNA (cytosine-5)-methyltransferase 1
MIKILDLYCGMGGLSLGLSLSLKDAEIEGLDIDKWAVATYNLNLSKFKCRARIQDVLTWKPTGDYDIIVGGVPCQPFSIANIDIRGEEHPLFPTFPRFFDVVLNLKPKAFMMENVKGLITDVHRHYLDYQVSRVSKDYRVYVSVLDSSRYGVPQRRERLFVVGIRKDLHAEFKFPRQTHGTAEHVTLDGFKVHRHVTLREAIGDLLTIPPSKGMKEAQVPDHVITSDNVWKSDWGLRVMRLNRPSYTISTKHRCGQLVSFILFRNSKGGVIEIPWTPWQSKHQLLDFEEPSPTVVSHLSKSSRHSLLPEMLDGKGEAIYRKLTVRECLRIQSFPDWWCFPNACPISNHYELVGEALPPILAYRLGVVLGRALDLPTKEPPREDEWALPYFRRAFADYFSGKA